MKGDNVCDNFVADCNRQWMRDLHDVPEIKFVMKMIDLNQLSIAACKKEWAKLAPNLQMITRSRLYFVPSHLTKIQFKYTGKAKMIDNLEK